jgi:hypothetical protein
MDTAERFVSIGGVGLIILNFWFFFGGRDEAPVRLASATSHSNQPIYACPMHPWITSTDPSASCSICGMKLVKKD